MEKFWDSFFVCLNRIKTHAGAIFNDGIWKGKIMMGKSMKHKNTSNTVQKLKVKSSPVFTFFLKRRNKLELEEEEEEEQRFSKREAGRRHTLTKCPPAQAELLIKPATGGPHTVSGS